MNHTIDGKCGKCGSIKELSTESYVTEPEREDAMSTEQQPFEGFKSIGKKWQAAIDRCARESSNGIFVHKYMTDLFAEELATAERSAREAAIREMVILSGKIEVEGHTTFEEWRAFKRFRNTMYDSLPSEGERE